MEKFQHGTSREDLWHKIQSELADLPGAEGIEERRKAYRPYFLRFGKDIVIEEGCRFYCPERISLDDDVRLNIGALIYGSGGVHIGRHVRIGPRCFLHSANHDIALDDKAFFEKSYIYKNVYIGDNCLISANVSILPGAKLGNGSFLACGAVVPNKNYGPNSYLAGIPANQLESLHKASEESTIYEEQPVIAFLTPENNSKYMNIARLLVTVLGCPQVRVYQDKSHIPESVQVSIAIGPEGWKPETYRGELWRLYYSKNSISGKALVNGVALPVGLEWALAPKIDPESSDLLNAFQVSAYYSLKRFSKIDGKGTDKEYIDITVLFWLQRKYGLMSEVSFKQFEDALEKNTFHSEIFFGDQKQISQEVESLQASLSGYDSIKKIPLKVFLNEPHNLVILVSNITKLDQLEALFDELLSRANKSLQLSYLGLAAKIRGFNNIYDKVIEKLFDHYYDHQTGCILSLPNAKSYNYSPVTVLLLALHESKPQIDKLYKRIVFDWGVLPAGEDSPWLVSNGQQEGLLVDKGLKLISSSLMENWVKLMTPPDLDDFPMELQEHNYLPILKQIEELWVKLLRDILLDKNLPFVQLKPWPFGYHNALSLRYDVDRNTVRDHVLAIVDIQKDMLGGNCATWFLLPGSAYNDRLNKLLPLYLQDIGLHAVDSAELKSGQGATFHSAPGAEYWRGALTVTAANQAETIYSEMLSTQLSVPRPVLIEENNSLHFTGTWYLPLHFPLEGSTADDTTAYFDRLAVYYKELLASGGHLILGSHPDLNQNILKEIVRRDQLGSSWCVTTETAVDRCKAVLGYGNISIGSFSDKQITLSSKNTVADLHVVVDWPAGAAEDFCLQLNKGMPRTIERRVHED